MGQLASFAELVEVTDLFARWVEGCQLPYIYPYAPAVVDLLSPWLLSILDRQRRDTHIAGLRGDEVAFEIPGMGRIVSDESLRRALSACVKFTQTLCASATY